MLFLTIIIISMTGICLFLIHSLMMCKIDFSYEKKLHHLYEDGYKDSCLSNDEYIKLLSELKDAYDKLSLDHNDLSKQALKMAASVIKLCDTAEITTSIIPNDKQQKLN